ncbi:receptor-like protein 15 [Manihot esculenta]|nr:receptor-like protein 15 [Manihot esculenta]
MLQGLLKDSFYNCPSLVVLDLSHNNLIGRIPKWIGEIPLGYILLSHNHFEGKIPIQLCKLDKLSLIDLSHNNLSGHVPYCLSCSGIFYQDAGSSIYLQVPVEFTTKYSSYVYQPNILRYFLGIDLSCNNLTGEIPPEIGTLSMIKVLNLTHNKLIGAIPPTFSNLGQIESLDLSYNNLEGKFPPQLNQLYSLVVFNVAHNNLSGKTLERVAQFATFDQSSYEGNLLLCGLPLPKSCNNTSPSPPVTPTEEKEDKGFMDMGVFYVSFVVSYTMVLLITAAVLYINPYWRRRWFYFIETSLINCYYFLVDNIPLLSKFGLS